MNLIDRAVNYVSPEWGNRRRVARLRGTMFDAARKDRTTSDWKTTTRSADGTIIPEADTLVARARGLCLNNGWCKSAKLAYQRNVVSTGIQVFPSATLPNGEPREAFNEAVEDCWLEWSNDRRQCDVERRLSINEQQRQIVGQVFEAGEQFVRLVVVDDASRVSPLSLQRIEPDALASDMLEANHRIVRRGIEVDALNAPVAYHFYRTAPNETLMTRRFDLETVSVPEAQIEHVYLQDRPGQSHGVPYIHAVMSTLRALEEFDLFQLEAAKTQATLALLITKDHPELGAGTIQAGVEGAEMDVEGTGLGETSLFEPNMIWTGKQGEKVEAFQPTHPGANYEAFIKAQIKNVGAGSDLSHSQILRDFSDGSYSSLRQQLLEDARAFRWWQQVLITRFLRPVYRQFVTYLILRGKVKAEGFFENSVPWLKADFMPPGFSWIDPLKEAQAQLVMWAKGLMTAKEIGAHRGVHWKRILEQWAKEREAFKALTGVDPIQVSADAKGSGKNGKAPKAPKARNADRLAEAFS